MNKTRKNWIEWLVFTASLAVIAPTLGFLVHAAFTLEDVPARIEVFLGEPREDRGTFIVPVVIQNRGGQAAVGVRVEVALTMDNASERAGFDLSYSPAGSTRRGEVSFIGDPRKGTLRARTPGFELP